VAEWRKQVAWLNHSAEFLRLEQHAEQPSMVMRAPYGNTDVLDSWRHVPPHPNIVEAISWTYERVLVRYAAIAWGRSGSNSQRTVATWGMQLVDAFELIRREVSNDLLGLFLRPLTYIDVGNHARLAFAGTYRDQRGLAPEIGKAFPRCEEPAVVYAVGQLLRQLSCVDDPTLETVIARASAENKRRRIKTLAELRGVLRPMATKAPIREGRELDAWKWFEAGVGWLELSWPSTALDAFNAALACDDMFGQAAEGRTVANKLIAQAHEQPIAPSTGSKITMTPASKVDGYLVWDDVKDEAHRFEQERGFGRALAIYRNVIAPTAPLFASRARCHLYLGETGEAIDYAQRAIRQDPSIALAHDILVTALLQRHMCAEALVEAERFVVAHPAAAWAHYVRGKALFALGRIVDARDAFEQASKLDPRLLEAQLLRREVERVTGNVRAIAGTQHAPTFEIPEQLAELRDVLISGDTNAAVTALRDDRYARDADAQLLLARFLAFDKRLDEAIAVYDQLEATSHKTAALVGKATALLDLGRTGDALSIFEQLPDDADAAEGAARALELLGRHDEAAEAYRRFIALASSGSDLRVRAAQLALEELSRRK